MYDFECSKCGNFTELNVPSDKRDNRRRHKGCGGSLKRVWLTPPASGVGAYQMKAVMFNRNEQKVGHVPGHFGKIAKTRKKKKA